MSNEDFVPDNFECPGKDDRIQPMFTVVPDEKPSETLWLEKVIVGRFL